MLFMEEHAEAVLPAMKARRDQCDAMFGCMSAPEIVKLTRVGRLNMDGSKRGAFDFLKKLRGKNPQRDRRRGATRDAAAAFRKSFASSPARRRTCAPIS